MSIKIMSGVWKHPYLTNHTDKLVLLALADWANDEGCCWPKMETIAAKSSLTIGAARDVVQRLEEAGYLTASRGGGRGKTNGYQLHIERGREVSHKRKSPAAKGVSNTGYPDPNPPPRTLFSDIYPPGQTGFVDGAYKENHQRTRNEPSVPSSADAAESGFQCEVLSDSPQGEIPKRSAAVEGAQASVARAAPLAADDPLQVAINAVCSVDTLATREKRINATAAARVFRGAGVSPEQIYQFGDKWRRHDWRGQRGDPPTPSQLRNDFHSILSREDAQPYHDMRATAGWRANGTYQHCQSPANARREANVRAHLDAIAERERHIAELESQCYNT